MNLSQPPATGNAELDRWLFLLWKQVQTPTVTAAPDQPAFVVDVPHGGTGASSLSGYLKGNGASPFTALSQIPYSDISGTPNVRVYGPNIDALDQTATTGIYAVTAYGSSAVRTMTGTLNRISVTNGDGVAGNPTFDISAAYVGQTSITTLGTITTGVWNAQAITCTTLTATGNCSLAATTCSSTFVATNSAVAGLGATTGISGIYAGSAAFSGYIGFSAAAGNRQGYIGSSSTNAAADTGTLPYVAGTHDFTGAITSNSTVTGTRLISTVAIGTAPLTVTSTTLVPNLYVARAALADSATTNANLTGPITSSGNATSIASQTGTGTKFVVDTSPTLVTPNIGAATATSLSTASLTSTGAVNFTAINAIVEIGALGSSNTPGFDFHSSATSNDYDCRLLASGGTAASANGLLTFYGLRLASDAPLNLKSYTVAGLPAGTNNDTAFVTDALAPAFGAAVAGGGAVRVPVYYDGAWKVG